MLTGHSVAVGDGKIIGVGPTAAIHEQFHATAVRRLDGQVLMPGLVNAHGHAAMVLLRGLAEDLPLDAWLRDRIWPIEAQWMSPDFVADGVALAMLEMLKSGTTCFSDMYFFPEVTAAHRAGSRHARADRVSVDRVSRTRGRATRPRGSTRVSRCTTSIATTR